MRRFVGIVGIVVMLCTILPMQKAEAKTLPVIIASAVIEGLKLAVDVACVWWEGDDGDAIRQMMLDHTQTAAGEDDRSDVSAGMQDLVVGIDIVLPSDPCGEATIKELVQRLTDDTDTEVEAVCDEMRRLVKEMQ